ncbi:MAG TPA: cupin domain-containing protein [Spirochaetota bacterium]|nr:cupin domain-containing protein [Spirochaetota bacterium]
MTAEKIIRMLRLEVHAEGGCFAESCRSTESIARGHLSPRYNGDRSFCTAIHYLPSPDTFSSMHRLASDEIFHHYPGDRVEMLHLFPDGRGKMIMMGADPAK